MSDDNARSGSSMKETGLYLRRQSGVRLNPLHIPSLDSSEPVRVVTAIPCNKWKEQEILKEIEDEGLELFHTFLKIQMENEPSIVFDNDILNSLFGHQNNCWLSHSAKLQCKATTFAQTERRRKIKELSLEVNQTMTEDEFTGLLCQYFYEDCGDTERILVLFFLCSDLTIHALSRDKECFQQYHQWSSNFISRFVTRNVHNQGGWGAVLADRCQPVVQVCLWGALSAMILFILMGLNRLKNG